MLGYNNRHYLSGIIRKRISVQVSEPTDTERVYWVRTGILFAVFENEIILGAEGVYWTIEFGSAPHDASSLGRRIDHIFCHNSSKVIYTNDKE